MSAIPRRDGLRQKVISGLAWSVVRNWGNRLITLGVFVLLARLLEPAEMGLFAAAVAVLAVVDVLIEQGFGDAIVQRRTLTRAEVNAAFYVTIVLAALAYAAIHPGKQMLMVGASGAVSGLMGGAGRIIAGHGGVGSILSRPVLALGAGWLAINLIFALVGGALIPGSGGADVAWEVHLAGFVVGVLLLSPFAWIARRSA